MGIHCMDRARSEKFYNPSINHGDSFIVYGVFTSRKLSVASAAVGASADTSAETSAPVRGSLRRLPPGNAKLDRPWNELAIAIALQD